MCTNVINELSRQLRTFFNFKDAVVRTQFLKTPTSIFPSEKLITPVVNRHSNSARVSAILLQNQVQAHHITI
ncbi:MAG: hypothetical protein ACTSV5_00525 [Promethearchaeota archaeon]